MIGHTERGRTSAESCGADTELPHDGSRSEKDVALAQNHAGEWKDVPGIYISNEPLQSNPIVSSRRQDES